MRYGVLGEHISDATTIVVLVEAVSKPHLTQLSDFGLFGGERSRRYDGLPSHAHG